MQRIITCIMCPVGCEMEVVCQENGPIGVTGNRCPKGEQYAIQELTAPMRNIASSVLVSGGEMPLVSVRLNQMIEKAKIPAVMAEIKAAVRPAPIRIGDIIINNAAGTGSDVIATKNIKGDR